MRHSRALVVVLALAGLLHLPAGLAGQEPSSAPPPAPPSATDEGLPRGTITEKVIARAAPEQSYALYLPSRYDPAYAWPLIIAFDPAARGRVPVELFQAAAEQYGYIVVGSNNSRNGPGDIPIEAFRQVWQDVFARFSIDARRVYATGFSGGARAATLVAHLCQGCLAGVIASGAGFSPAAPLNKEIPFVYFSAVGLYDFNYAELAGLQETLDNLDIPNLRRVFDGAHQWAPPEVLTQAVEWMELQAMARGRRPRDEVFIDSQWQRAEAAARAFEEHGALADAYHAYMEMAATFRSLRDVSAAVARAEQLGQTKQVRAALKQEARQRDEQRAWTQELLEQIEPLRTATTDRASLLSRLRARVAALRRRREREKDPGELAVLRRALSQVSVTYFEAGQHMLEEKDYALAVAYFQVVAEVVPQNPRIDYTLASTLALAGREKDALAALRRAVEKGFDDLALLETDKDLDSIRHTPEYLEILQTLAAKPRS